MFSLDALASRLRRLRQRHELTQEQFAETIGLSYKFYQQIEAGRKKQIWLETVERLAAGFGLEAWQLLAPEDPVHTTVGYQTADQEVDDLKAVAESADVCRTRSITKNTRARRSKKP